MAIIRDNGRKLSDNGRKLSDNGRKLSDNGRKLSDNTGIIVFLRVITTWLCDFVCFGVECRGCLLKAGCADWWLICV